MISASEALALGLTTEADDLLALGRRRTILRPQDATVITAFEPMVHAVSGRSIDAAKSMRQLDDTFGGNRTLSIEMLRHSGTVIVLNEQMEWGTEFDRAVHDFEAVAKPPEFLIRTFRWVQFEIALTQVARFRQAEPVDRAQRRRIAIRSVRLLRRARWATDVRIRALLVRADFLVCRREGQKGAQATESASPGDGTRSSAIPL